MNTFDSFVYTTLNAESVQVVKHEPTKLDSLIGSFSYSIRKADESEFEFHTLTSYHRCIDRYLLENNYQTQYYHGPSISELEKYSDQPPKRFERKG